MAVWGCQAAARSTESLQNESGPRVRTELYMGLARAGLPNVSDAEWAEFLASEVTPRFPRGLTVITAQGQWLQDGSVVREPSRILVLVHARGAEAETAIEAIRTAYCRRFKQDAVMRVDDDVRVRIR